MPTLEVGSYTLSPSLMATEKEVRVNLDSIDVIDRVAEKSELICTLTA